MNVRELRQQRGWSQEQVAQFSGLSVRTTQRIEQGQNPGLESLKALAAVFDVQVADLQTPGTTTQNSTRAAALYRQHPQLSAELRRFRRLHRARRVLVVYLVRGAALQRIDTRTRGAGRTGPHLLRDAVSRRRRTTIARHRQKRLVATLRSGTLRMGSRHDPADAASSGGAGVVVM